MTLGYAFLYFLVSVQLGHYGEFNIIYFQKLEKKNWNENKVKTIRFVGKQRHHSNSIVDI